MVETSKQTRRRHSAEFKAKVAVAALREDKTLGQLSSEYGVHSVVISGWKKQVLASLPGVFGDRSARLAHDAEQRERELFEKIGCLEMELAWLKKSLDLCIEGRRALLDVNDTLSIRTQCRLLGVDRSGVYHQRKLPGEQTLQLCHRVDELYTEQPCYGVEKMTFVLRCEGWEINPKRVRRVLRHLGLWAVYPKPRKLPSLSEPGAGGQKFPYLLRGLSIIQPHQVWAVDITYIRLRHGYAYLVAIIDWFSRYVLAWELAPSLETFYCLRTLQSALQNAGCSGGIMNSDQGSQFTSHDWISAVASAGMKVSHDGRGRALDNVMVERLWRTVKYEDVYLRDYADLPEARTGLQRFFTHYNQHRPHQGLKYQTPEQVILDGTLPARP